MVSVLLVIAISIILVMIAFLLALYSIPVVVTGRLAYYERLVAMLFITWGILSCDITSETREIQFRLFGHGIFRRPFTVEELFKEEEKKLEPFVPEAEGEIPPLQQIRTFISVVPHFLQPIRTLLHSLKIRSVTCNLRLGLGDAPATGILYGYFWAVKGLLTPVSQVHMNMQPVFDGPFLEGDGEVTVAFQKPLMIVLSMVRLIKNREVRRYISSWSRS